MEQPPGLQPPGLDTPLDTVAATEAALQTESADAVKGGENGVEEVSNAVDATAPSEGEPPAQATVAADEVTIAEEPADPAEPAEAPKWQVTLSQLPGGATVDDLRPIVEECGTVLDIELGTDPESGEPNGTATVTYDAKEAAEGAVEKLHQQKTLEGAEQPIEVALLTPPKLEPVGESAGSKKRKAWDEATEDQDDKYKQLFFARCPRLVVEEQLSDLFAQHGHVVKEVILFKPTATAPDSRGCGLLNFESHEAAAAALQALNGVHTWPTMSEPMVLKWGLPPDKRPRPPEPAHYGGSRGGGGRDRDAPPAGCDPDAMRIFIGGIPREATLRDCEEYFGKYGPLVDFYLVRDRFTRESRGIAYVWYAHRADAEACVEAVHNKLFMPGFDSEARPMTVARAQPRPTQPGGGGGGGYQRERERDRDRERDPYRGRPEPYGRDGRMRPMYSSGQGAYAAPPPSYGYGAPPPAYGYGYAYPPAYGYSAPPAYADPNAAYGQQGYYTQDPQQQQAAGGYQQPTAATAAHYQQPATAATAHYQQAAAPAQYQQAATAPAAAVDASGNAHGAAQYQQPAQYAQPAQYTQAYVQQPAAGGYQYQQ